MKTEKGSIGDDQGNKTMKRQHHRLVDPSSGDVLFFTEDALVSEGGRRFPIIEGIPRFVTGSNYTRAFGDQWNRFPRTQLDSYTGIPLSATRIQRCLCSSLDELNGKLVLEAGSGAGRFTEVLLAHGAIVDSFDYSHAVLANFANNGSNRRLTLVQADLFNMPFRRAEYDAVVCLGVLQHTPDPDRGIRELWERVKPGGVLVFDHYRRKLRNYLPPPFGVAGMLYRWYFLRVPKQKQFETVKAVFDFWFPWVWRFRKSSTIQFILSRMSPIVNYFPHFGLKDREMYYEWMLLDTHDAMTDIYKHRRTLPQIIRLLNSLGAIDIVVRHGGNGIEAFCKKPK